MARSYDDWKTAASNPGSVGSGEPRTYRVRCVECAWAFTGTGLLAAATAVAQADRHHQATGHAVAGDNGVVQARWTSRPVAASAAG